MSENKIGSIQNQIRNYVLNLIRNINVNDEEWIIPTEGFLRRKFSCSRETVRSALVKLVYLGFISPVKGKGYIASNNLANFNYNFNIDVNDIETNIRVLENKKHFSYIEKTFSYIKEYTYKNEQIAWSLCSVNKEIVYDITKEDVKEGLINFLIQKNYDLFKIEKIVEIYDLNKDDHPYYDLISSHDIKLKGLVPITFTRLLNKSNELIEVSIVIINPKYFHTETHSFF